jgi:L-fuculose-phosphate aldolase
VIGTAGNVSVRCEEHVVATPTGCVFSSVSADEMSIVSLDGERVDGLAPTSELGLHLGAYNAFDWVSAVVHTHSPVATALSCVLDELPPIHYQMLSLGGGVRVAPYATFGSDELHRVVLSALEGRTATLMQNHGTLAIGPSLDAAVENALLLEWACELYWRASMVGSPRVLSESELSDVMEQVQQLDYGRTRE